MKRLPDGVGRTIFIATIAGSIFAAFLMVTPKLTTAVGDAATGSVSGIGETATTSPAVPTTTPAVVTTTAAPEAATTTRPPVLTPTTTIPGLAAAEVWEPMTAALGYDGTVRLTLHIEGEDGGGELATLSDLDTVVWRLHVINTTDQELWGVFAWVERAGRADCDDHHLAAFGETDCWVSSTVFSDDSVAEAWVNAWTTTRQVKDRVSVPLTVTEL